MSLRLEIAIDSAMLGELNRLATTYVYGFLVYPAVAPRLDFVAKQQVTPDAI